jgi:hypothetical protein
MGESNITRNAVFLFILMLTFFGLIVIFTVGNQLVSKTQDVATGMGVDLNNSSYAQPWRYTELKQFLITNFLFLVYFCILLVAYSSFINSNDIKGYIATCIGGVIVTIIIINVSANFWNEFITHNDILDFSDFTTNDLWFVNNIGTLFVVNLVAGFLSFIFVKKNIKSDTASGY